VAYLVGRGVDKGRLTAVGYGETRPIDTNQSEAGRARNRRVELVIK
jgi:outer membrane protein OmpA-like peptidoglycan-associated protein